MAYLSLEQYLFSPKNEFIKVLKDRHKKERIERSLKVITIKGGESLPEDLIIEILSWLPVKTLLQFKSLCKSWYNIIAKPEFVSKHLENYYGNNHSMDCILTLNVVTQAAEVDLCARFVDEALGIYVDADLLIIRPPFGHEFEIDGPCNGIYVVNSGWSNDLRAFWNPTIKELKVLPPLVMNPNLPSNLTYYIDYDTYGIGFNPLTKDYKVVVIKRYNCASGWSAYECTCHNPLSVLVYSSKTDSWKYWGDLRQPCSRVEKNVCYIFVNGCFYLIATSRDEEFEQIISVDIVAESLQEIQMPKYEKPAIRSLGVYHDSVALYSVHPKLRHNTGDKFCDIWTHNEGGWTKKVTIGPLLGCCIPLGTVKDDKAVLVYGNKLVLCDPDTKQMWDITRDLGSNFEMKIEIKSVVVYKESLVSLKDLASIHSA